MDARGSDVLELERGGFAADMVLNDYGFTFGEAHHGSAAMVSSVCPGGIRWDE